MEYKIDLRKITDSKEPQKYHYAIGKKNYRHIYRLLYAIANVYIHKWIYKSGL